MSRLHDHLTGKVKDKVRTDEIIIENEKIGKFYSELFNKAHLSIPKNIRLHNGKS